MANFESGVKDYIKTYAVVEVNFPIDFKDNPDVSCYQCRFFSRNTGMCQLNKEIPSYPQKYVGERCPLQLCEEREEYYEQD